MDQNNILADALSKASPSLSSLLSQTGGLFGGTASQNDLFSNLLSQSGDAQISQKTTLSNASTANAATSTASTYTISSVTTGTNSSSSALLQTLRSLSSTLHKTLTNLHQQNRTNSGAGQPAQSRPSDASPKTAAQNSSAPPSPPSPSPPPATSIAAQPATTETATNTANTDAATNTDTTTQNASTDPTQTLSDILSELQAMVQMTIQALEQAQTKPTTGDTSAAAQAVATLADTLDQLTGGQTTSDKASPLAMLTKSLGDTVDANASVETTDAQTPSDLFQNLLAAMEKTIKQSAAVTGASATQNAASSATTPALNDNAGATDTSDITTQLQSLQDTLKTLVTTMQRTAMTAQQNPTPQSPSQSSQTTPPAIPLPFIIRPVTPPSALTAATSDKTDAVLNPLQQATLATTTTSPPTPVSPAGTATATVSTLLVAAADKNTANGENTADLLGNNNGNASSAQDFTLRGGLNNAGTTSTGTTAFASQLASLRPSTTTSPLIQPAVVDQVVLQMSRNLKNGSDQMSLQLHPAELGKITVKLDFGADGKVQGTVTADNQATLQLLQKDSRGLERALQDAGLRADSGSLQFSMSGQSGNQSKQSTGQNKTGDGTFSAQGTEDGGDAGSVGDAASNSGTETYYVTPHGVNISV